MVHRKFHQKDIVARLNGRHLIPEIYNIAFFWGFDISLMKGKKQRQKLPTMILLQTKKCIGIRKIPSIRKYEGINGYLAN